MSLLAEFPRGIPIPMEDIRSALESVAVPGFTGTLQLEIIVGAEAAKCVSVAVIRRQVKKVDQPATTHQVLPDPSRKKPVERVIEDIKGKLLLRSVLAALEIQVADGILQKITLVE
jgi:hypothetical protein